MIERVGINVLSLFDGMGCAQIALERAGIKIANYFASEIDKHAIKVTMANYPNTIQLGSVVDLDTSKLPPIEILCGGSPCQSFSFAGKMKGMSTKDQQDVLTLEHYLELKSKGYEFEGQSYLFWEYVRILKEVNPKYFLLENVVMEKKWEKVISKALGVEPKFINSRLVSAQDRKRLYWTNIKIKRLADRKVYWRDISEDGFYAGSMRGRRINGAGNRDDYNKNIDLVQHIESRLDNKTNCLTTVGKDNVASRQKVGRTLLTKVEWRYFTRTEMEKLQTVPVGYTSSVSKSQAGKILGNGWTIDVVAHIFSDPIEIGANKESQMSLELI